MGSLKSFGRVRRCNFAVGTAFRGDMGDTVSLSPTTEPDDGEKPLPSTSDVPDRFHLAYLAFVLLGAGILFPYNSFITAYDWFTYLYPDAHVEFWFTLFHTYPNLLFTLLHAKFGPRFSYRARIEFSCAIMLTALVVIPWIESQPGAGLPPSLFITMVGVLFTGTGAAILWASLCTFASEFFPPVYIQAIILGKGSGGLAVAIVRIVTKAALPATPTGLRVSTYLFFGAGALAMVSCMVVFLLLPRLPFVAHRLQATAYKPLADSPADGGTAPTPPHPHAPLVLAAADTLPDGAMPSPLPASPGDDSETQRRPSSSGGGSSGGGSGSGGASVEWSALRTVLRKVWPNGLQVSLVFAVTLCVFPGVVTEIRSQNPALGDWFAISLISVFILVDWIGQLLPRFRLLFSSRQLWIPTLSRFLFFPWLVLCVKGVLAHDAWAYSAVVLLALSNGYCGVSGMMYCTEGVEEREKETAGAIMSAFLNGGVFVGINLSLLILRFL